MPQRRKTGRPQRLEYIGGFKHGVMTTDPGGRQRVTPFNGDNTTVLSGDGTFVDATAAGDLSSKQDKLFWCEELGAYLIDR